MMQTLADGAVEASVTGSGPTVWIFHSLLADAGSCGKLAAALADAHRVIVPNLPGFGRSAPAGPALDAVADRMAEAMRDAGAPASIIGNGYGSFVALTLALRHPALVDRLVLAGTGAAFDEPGRAAFRNMAAAAESKGLGAIAEVAMRRLFAPEFQGAHPALMAERRAGFLATDPAVFTGACTALAGLDLREKVQLLQVPTLVMAGEGDEATPPRMAEELANLLPDSRFKLLPGLAHVPQLQDTTAFVAAMDGFV